MSDRYPGYDVLAKRQTLSWNDKTREVIDRRLALPGKPRFFSEAEWRTLVALCDRIIPQPNDRPPAPLAAMIDDKLLRDRGDGYRRAGLPRQREAWRIGLAALDAEAQARHGQPFHALDAAARDELAREMERGALADPAWRDMPSALFFTQHALRDVVAAYYAHPTAWSEIGFGGPASPRGYVRLGDDHRDPWEAEEARDDPEAARRANRHVG